MKTKRTSKQPTSDPAVIQDAALPYQAGQPSESMVRTQIYLNQSEYEFVQREAARQELPMAAIIRSYIEEKMQMPADAWTNNPLLEPTPDDPEWKGHEDSAINHDHYIYGCPRKYIKVKGKWVLAPPHEE